jgi:hypothetical protein
LDGVGAALSGLLALGLAGEAISPPCSDDNSLCFGPSEDDRGVLTSAAIVFGAISTLQVVAITSGVRKTRTCREANRRYAAWHSLSPDGRRELQSAPACRQLVREWRNAGSPARRAPVYNRMSPECREVVLGARREEAEQRARAQRERANIAPECERPIAEWRQERDFVKKTKLYDRLPADCKQSVTIIVADP